ncbi:MAG: hypothetical protein D6744_18140 [Planctomycetota bacterium]|nr:MAG: hypothetical protein D6744_18140 [Planctomycetota bacterium]
MIAPAAFGLASLALVVGLFGPVDEMERLPLIAESAVMAAVALLGWLALRSSGLKAVWSLSEWWDRAFLAAIALRCVLLSLQALFSLPILRWFAAGAGVVVVVTFVGGMLTRRRRGASGCRSCGYDLTGNVSGACPECGAPAGRAARRADRSAEGG